ncbi:hypothetical protein ACQJBY_052398 [Aegilops geniculata]
MACARSCSTNAPTPSRRRRYHSLRLPLLCPHTSDALSFTSTPTRFIHCVLRPSAWRLLKHPMAGLSTISQSTSGTIPSSPHGASPPNWPMYHLEKPLVGT